METTDSYLRAKVAGMEQRGLALDLLCLAGEREPGITLTKQQSERKWGDEDFEDDRTLVGDRREIRLNPVPILKGVIWPGGRIVLLDCNDGNPHFAPVPCEIDEIVM